MLSDLKKIWKNYLKKNTSPEDSTAVIKPSASKNNGTSPDIRKKKIPIQELKNDYPVPDRNVSSLPQNTFAGKNRKQGQAIRSLDRHGLRKITSDEDLNRLFDEATSHNPNFSKSSKVIPTSQGSRMNSRPAGKPKKTPSTGLHQKRGMDKNGLPFLSKEFNLMVAFEDKNQDQPVPTNSTEKKTHKHYPAEEDFEEMLSQSLAGKTVKKLLQEKDSAYQHAKPVTLNEKIKRYPAPESELDLHGFTAAQAREKSELFVRNGLRTGKLTIRIIVGKGLHSEDQAVLPDVVEDKLKELKKENIVLAFRWEKQIKKRSGAIIVYLV
ncbi:MAG: Smr/MutS family protein [Proteobacteria bacterium]|nr:Smr/MutS family protein [Pseudomonadota bacterium]